MADAAFLGVERSLTGRRWRLRSDDDRAELMLAQRLGQPEIIGRVLAARGVGCDEAETVQYEGLARRCTTPEEPLQALYFERFPDGRSRLAVPDLVYYRVAPTWIRYSDFRSEPPSVVEWSGPGLERLLRES